MEEILKITTDTQIVVVSNHFTNSSSCIYYIVCFAAICGVVWDGSFLKLLAFSWSLLCWSLSLAGNSLPHVKDHRFKWRWNARSMQPMIGSGTWSPGNMPFWHVFDSSPFWSLSCVFISWNFVRNWLGSSS